MFETPHEHFPQGLKIPMFVRIGLQGLSVSEYASATVRKQIKFFDARPDRPRHVVDLFSIRRHLMPDEEIIEIPRDTDRHLQIFSVSPMQFRTRYDCILNEFNSIHTHSSHKKSLRSSMVMVFLLSSMTALVSRLRATLSTRLGDSNLWDPRGLESKNSRRATYHSS